MTIERKDNSKGYFPANCTWIPPEKQARNKTTNLYFELNGERKLLKDWAKEYGMKYGTIYGRVILRKIDLLEALTTPSKWDHKYRNISFIKSHNKWKVEIQKNNKRYLVGYFQDKEDALQAKLDFMTEKGWVS